MLITRKEFADMFNRQKEGLGDPGSVLWEAECDISNCQWFAKVKPLKVFRPGYKHEYWD